MIGWLALPCVLLVAIACDWVAVTRLGAYVSDFDYRYWPLSGPRQLGLAALLVALAYAWLVGGTIPPLLLLVPCILLFAIWGVGAVRDVDAQRRVGYQEPPRYSDGDC